MDNSELIEHDFKKRMILMEKDLIIESLKEKLEILNIKHHLKLMQSHKKLRELGYESIGLAFYDQFKVAFMELQTGNESIPQIKFDESKSFKSKKKFLRICRK